MPCARFTWESRYQISQDAVPEIIMYSPRCSILNIYSLVSSFSSSSFSLYQSFEFNKIFLLHTFYIPVQYMYIYI